MECETCLLKIFTIWSAAFQKCSSNWLLDRRFLWKNSLTHLSFFENFIAINCIYHYIYYHKRSSSCLNIENFIVIVCCEQTSSKHLALALLLFKNSLDCLILKCYCFRPQLTDIFTKISHYFIFDFEDFIAIVYYEQNFSKLLLLALFKAGVQFSD